MRTIEVSDEVYERLRIEADARGLTVEAYVEGSTNEPDFVFGAEHLAAIDRARDDIAAKRVSSWDEAERWISTHRAVPSADVAR